MSKLFNNVLSKLDSFIDFSKTSISESKFTIPIELYEDKLYNPIRRQMLLLLDNIISKEVKNEKILSQMIIDIELSVYNKTVEKKMYKTLWCPLFEKFYRLHMNRITKNLDQESEVGSDYLINKIINDNTFDIKYIASAPSSVLCPDKSIEIIKLINIKSSQKIEMKTSSEHRCRNCKQSKAYYKEIQLRRIDEASNLSLTCTYCKYKWIE